jgi:hypothetical protein
MSYSLRIGERRFYGLRGNLHMHTPLSDGTKGRWERSHLRPGWISS